MTAERAPFESVRARAIALLDAPRPLLVVSDFDGTLSAIDPDPLGARIEPLGRVALRRLSRIAAARPDQLRVFVLSGRAALDVAARVRVGGLHYLGNHGLEGGPLPARVRAERLAVAIEERLLDYVEPARALGHAVFDALGRPDWLFVEHKGPSVAFHFRGAPDPDAARRRIDDAVADARDRLGDTGLERMEGRKVLEFRPAEAGGKGTATARLLEREGPGAALALGDDVSDAEAFRVIAAAREAGRLTALTVAVHGAAETPGAVLAAADVVLPSPRHAARLLSALGHELQRRLAPELPWMAGRGAAVAAGGARGRAQPVAPVAASGRVGIAGVRGTGGHPPPPEDGAPA